MWVTGGGKISDVLDKFDSNLLESHDIVHCIKKLRKYGRHHHCFEIMEWMEKREIDFSEYPLRISILCKVKGIHEVEKYFDSLPPVAKNNSTYGALLNCYCSENMIEEALALFGKMDEMGYASNEIAFTNLMCLYMKVDQPEKVPHLIEEMKRRNISLGTVSYQVWVQSYACLNNLEGLEQVMEEYKKCKSLKDVWGIYSNFASAYIKTEQYEKAKPFLKKIEEILDSSVYPERITYHILISSYASIGDLKSVVRAWDKLRSKFKACNNTSYLTILNALSKLDNIELLKYHIETWRSKYKTYDVRLPAVVMGAYLRHDMFNEAELLLKDATDRAGQNIWAAHLSFMKYFLRKRQIESALKHLEVALANQWPWHRNAGKLDDLFEYFIEEKDVEGAEQVCQMLEKVQPLLSMLYLRLLRTYAAAGKTAPEMRHRMVQGGIDIGTEHEELLEKVCPN
ncbi:hypothetical protein BVRB_5g121950 [Beta vulgaris subsp. vulgaris]|nr:hypothetical protein BVRB_5g121950 [Beta vulgaris subsp. vulgaris]